MEVPTLTGTYFARPSSFTPTCNPASSLVRWPLSPFHQRQGLDSLGHLSGNGNHAISLLAWEQYKHGGVSPQVEGQHAGGDAPSKDAITGIHSRVEQKAPLQLHQVALIFDGHGND